MDSEVRVCLECGRDIGPGMNFCPGCGRRSSAEGTARTEKGSSVEIPGRIQSQVHELLTRKMYIEAIRLLREDTGMSLKEAKVAVDAYAAENSIDTGVGRTSAWSCLLPVLGFFLWMAFIGVLPFVARRFAPVVFGPGISEDSVEACMALLPILMTLVSLALLFFFLLRKKRRRNEGMGGVDI